MDQYVCTYSYRAPHFSSVKPKAEWRHWWLSQTGTWAVSSPLERVAALMAGGRSPGEVRLRSGTGPGGMCRVPRARALRRCSYSISGRPKAPPLLVHTTSWLPTTTNDEATQNTNRARHMPAPAGLAWSGLCSLVKRMLLIQSIHHPSALYEDALASRNPCRRAVKSVT